MAKTSLAVFAKNHPPRRRADCRICALTERAEIDAARKNGAGMPTTILDWLVKECGYQAGTITKRMLSYHFSEQHHEQAR